MQKLTKLRVAVGWAMISYMTPIEQVIQEKKDKLDILIIKNFCGVSCFSSPAWAGPELLRGLCTRAGARGLAGEETGVPVAIPNA